MSFMNWFSSKPPQAKPAAHEEHKRVAPAPQRHAAENLVPADTGKVKRHARREQLYVAIREAMTRSGVLSASYKFKVLSLDQGGNEFLVMMDLAKAFGGPPEQLGEIETLIMQHAKTRFEITVPAVYWRLDELAVVVKPAAPAVHQPTPAPAVRAETNVETPPAKPAAPRYEPIQADEVAAFKQALAAASAQGPAVSEKGVKVHSGPRSYTLLTGFEDTEMPPDSAAMPALSSTQYGDLH
ncbi:MAG: hypothetical protein ABI893_09135 [Polaromonas sp.]|uniref:hypothetical protein n=1 Tax=Polaromonas sp. TaxID=1869339 RepID=UPI003265FCAE